MEYPFLVNSSLCELNPDVLAIQAEFFAIAQSTDVIVMTCVLSVSGLVGVIGNSIVIIMCLLYPSSQATQNFILAMAVSDLVVCSAIIPYRIISYHVLITELSCKIFEGLTYCTVYFSGTVLIAVAFERYIAVCKPLTFCCSAVRAKITIVCLCVMSVAVSITAGLIAGHYVVIDDVSSDFIFCFTGVCIEDGQDTRIVSEEGIDIYSKVLAAAYLFLVPTVTILYGNIFWVLHKRYGVHVKRISRPTVFPETVAQQALQLDVVQESDIKIYSIHEDPLGSKEDCIQEREVQRVKPTKAPAPHPSVKIRATKKYLYHKRAATILVLVTVFFIVTYLPFLLIKLKLVENIVTIRLSFFLSSMINPLIYSFTNKKFRDNVKKTIQG